MRLLDAIVELVAEHGYAKVRVGAVARHAGVSLSTFYEHFEGKEACFLAAYDTVCEGLVAGMVDSTRGATSLEDGIRKAAAGYLGWFADRPTAARTFMVEVRGAGPAALRRRSEAIERFVDVASESLRRVGRADLPPPRDRMLAIFGSVEAIAADRVLAGRAHELRDVVEHLVDATTRLLAP
ncbi:TetR/AcrR family transcriptional regulator [Paraconexibacter sp.]|uniref:TetR/AcrR family transcriptional regulator n=1 Tax=Paraconexibacter sp. TaxID=2949640 RepID=UPI0035657D49